MTANGNREKSGTIRPPPKTTAERLAEKRTLALWALLGNGGAGFGGLMTPKIEKAERESLAHDGLVAVEKRGRSLWLEVTDRGWRWAEEHLGDPLPDKSYAGASVLQAWLARLRGFMSVRELGLAEVLAPAAVERVETSVPVAPATDFGALRLRIREAYLATTGGKYGTRALISDIRSRLGDVDRGVLDEALLRMQREEEAVLMPLDNRLEITNRDRDAALQIGREQRHILWISR